MRIQAVAAAILPPFLLSVAIVSFRGCGDRPSQYQQYDNESARCGVEGDTLQYSSGQRGSGTQVELRPPWHNGLSGSRFDSGHRSDILWAAICQVESGGDPNAYNEREGAAGIAQIRPILVRDVARIDKTTKYQLSDRFNVAASRRMFRVYLRHWSKTGTDEEAARMWCSGPTGMSKAASLPYWEKVKKEIEKLRKENDRAD